jgi:hypothetical protein
MTLPTEKTWKISVIFFSSDPPLPQRKGGKKKSLFSLKKIAPIYQFLLLITGIKRNPNLAGDGETVVESFFKNLLCSLKLNSASHTYI